MPLQKPLFAKLIVLAAILALCLSAALASACAPSAAPEETAPVHLDLRGSGIVDMSDLLRQTQLESLDLRGNEVSVEDYAALHAALPNCDIAWSVPFDGGRIDSTATELTLSVPSGKLLDALRFFPDLQTVRLEQTPDAAAIESFTAQYPQVSFLWNVTIGASVYPNGTTSLDLSGRPVDLTLLQDVLPLLPALRTVTFSDESFPQEEQLALVESYPSLSFVWSVQLLDDLSVRSDAAELDLRDYSVPDAAAFSERLRLLPALTYLDMCGCGPSDEEMAAMRARYPQVKFVWYTHVAGWILRTDIQGFSTGNRSRFPNGAGWYAADNFPYRTVSSESLANLKYCTDLIALDIGHCTRVKNIDFLATLPRLKYLDIALCDLTDISALASQPDLIYLQMMYNLVWDISPLKNCKELRFLNLSDNQIMDAAPLFELTKLERLWINCTGLSKEQVAALEQAMPDTIIKASPTNPEYAMSYWCKGNEGYITVQTLYGLRAKYQ
jgi:Leucine-rich repeat (LRR) protein